ncbi:ATP-binding protein [Fodinicola feengrottensis]|uniref:ATP-binding protein n=1 Tax=Fodinicola feengrottensis TaxID=435914 RepID=UPI0013D7A504|nr:ATP-binding protein [Fodinicola feengrottensis]
MYLHSGMISALAIERQRELVADAERRTAPAERGPAGPQGAVHHQGGHRRACRRYAGRVRPKRNASPMMIGRDRELRQLTQLASSPRPEVALVAGEPGIGKTRLIQEFLAKVPAGTVALVGRAEPDSLARPYELLLDAVSLADDDPQLQALTDPARSPVERLHTGIDLVDRLVGDAPAVIVFDDLHWADSESAARCSSGSRTGPARSCWLARTGRTRSPAGIRWPHCWPASSAGTRWRICAWAG